MKFLFADSVDSDKNTALTARLGYEWINLFDECLDVRNEYATGCHDDRRNKEQAALIFILLWIPYDGLQ